jgi:hypothetical protein
MFAFADVMKFLADKFPGLGGHRFPSSRILLGPFDGRSLWHDINSSSKHASRL